ncbi:LamG domain-containing protein [Verrucomicrobium sp. BvORR034]|uniref:LamG domain-containing protein n=1 Tax=Verrucomicrobium sp. BvORR034 TaxID=1396418 RepID=UPI0009DFF261|nr:LamG domain-containing protein [Verrucomicrobium sp. BvORR034]
MRCFSIPRLIFAAASTLAATVLLAAPLPCAASTLIYFQFNGTDGASASAITDSSSYGLNGTASASGSGQAPKYSSQTVGPVITNGIGGEIVNANNTSSLKFDNTGTVTSGDGGRITVQDPIGSDSLLEPSSFTVEAFIKVQDSIQYPTLVSKSRVDGGGSSWLVDTNSNNTLRVRTDHQAIGVATSPAPPGFNQSISSTQNIADGNWHHFAVTYDATGKRFTIYLDYVSIGTGTLSGGELNLVYDDNPLLIGQGGGGRAFDGWMDEFRFTDSVLTSDQFLRAVPEPGRALLLALAGAMMLTRRRRPRPQIG